MDESDELIVQQLRGWRILVTETADISERYLALRRRGLDPLNQAERERFDAFVRDISGQLCTGILPVRDAVERVEHQLPGTN